jgi:hypothetical protein
MHKPWQGTRSNDSSDVMNWRGEDNGTLLRDSLTHSKESSRASSDSNSASSYNTAPTPHRTAAVDIDEVPELLAYLHVAVKRSVVWNMISGLEDPVGVISGSTPHFFLKCSVNFSALLGYTQEQVFGRSLAHFIPVSDDESSSRSHRDPSSKAFSSREENQSTASQGNEDNTSSTHHKLSEFYSALSRSPAGPVHVMLPIVCADGRILPTVSIHAFPIMQRQARTMAPATQQSSAAESGTFTQQQQQQAPGHIEAPLDILTARYTAASDSIMGAIDGALGLNRDTSNQVWWCPRSFMLSTCAHNCLFAITIILEII